MSSNLQTMTLGKRFEHIFRVISGKRFKNREGLGNEAPFFICPYDPRDADEADCEISHLKSRLRTEAGINALCVDLYELSLDILRKRETGFLESIIQKEPNWTHDKMLRLLQNVLDPAEYLVPALGKRLADEPHDVCFLKGVGKVFPYIRAHTVLSNLHATQDTAPVVLFFPGEFVKTPELGASLDLFGRLHGDKYYRAFNIFHYEP